MLAKVGNVLIEEKKITQYKKLTFYLFLLGLILFFALPIIADKIFITEKQVKNSEVFHNQFNHNFFHSEYEKINTMYNSVLKNKKGENALVNEISYDNLINEIFLRKLFKEGLKKEEVQSIDINSQRGERLKFIIINIIYDNNLSESHKNLLVLFSFINHFSQKYKSNYYWLSKDIQINFIQSELFYKSPKLCNEILIGNKNKKIKEGQIIDFVINIDSTKFNFKNLILKIHGANSEIVDMDFYKIIVDNISSQFSLRNIKTFGSFFTQKTKRNLFKFYSHISDVMILFLSFLKPIGKEKNVESNFVYFLENVIENYLHFNEDIDTNNLLISSGYNSVLIKSADRDSSSKSITTDNYMYDSLKFLQSLEKIIKVFSKSEIELFRGDYNYILFNTMYFVNVGIFLFVPVCLVIRIFYEILDKIYLIHNKREEFAKEKILNKNTESNFNAAKIVTVLLISLISQNLLLLHIGQIKSLHESFNNEICVFSILGLNFLFSYFIFSLGKFSQEEHILCENIFRLLFSINCFNFLFINYGFGLLITIVVFPCEMILIKFSNRLSKILMLLILIFALTYQMNFLNMMIFNYLEYFNNVYPIWSVLFAMITSRINLYLN